MKPVRRVVLLAIAMVMALIPAVPGGADSHESLVITGVVDGPLSGGVPKAIELTALADIPDLSVYGVESANNGGGAVAPEFTFPADSLSAGDVVYLASESTAFESFFCAAPDYTGSVANVNGDDAIALYSGGVIVDVFGEVTVDGTNQPWEYLDGWAKRDDGTGPDGSTFEIANWTFSGINALDGETRNDLAATPFPFEGASDCNGGGTGGDSDLVVSGVVDGPLTGGIPKAIELTALADIPDLSVYGVESANNGGGAVGPEFTFPADSLSAGGVIYLASESTAFEAFFCAAPNYTGSVANVNGDDAIALYSGGVIVDVFGEVTVDGTNQPWEYLDGWAKRDDGTGPDGSTFAIANWSFSGPNALDGETRNDLAATPFPFEGVSDCSEPEPELTKIHDIQGSGAESPLLGERVIIEGIVVGDFETFGSLAGFFVQEEDADADTDPATSEGVFVFNSFNDTVDVGDLVRVEGTVEERFGNTQLTNSVEITKLAEGVTLPTPGSVSFPLTSVDDLEAYEGMNATFSQTLSIIEYFNFDRFGETVVGLPLPGEDRHFQPTAVYEPGSSEAAALAIYNALSRITIDDGRTSQNPDPAIHPGNGEVFDLGNRFNGGDTITGITGAIYYTFNLYRIMPTEYGEYVAANPRDLTPEPVGGDLKIATLNALNYFSTIDTGVPACGPNLDQDCRGADDENERQRQLTKLTEALIGMDADIVGLIEVENTAGVEPLEDIVDALNDQLGKDTYRYVKAGENSVVGTDAIKVGIIYKKASVVPNAEPAILDDPSFLDPRNLGDDKNRAALAQTFNQKGTGEKVTVVVNHLKSKGSGCGEGDDDPEQGSCNLTRTLAAQALLDWIDADPTHMNDPDFLIIGDLNSYDREDPIDVLRAGGYADLLFEYQGELAYSYLFGGALGYLDYGMSSMTLTPQVTGATAWHINSDEPDILDYDTSFKKDAQDALFEENAFRSSDHDAVIIGLDLNRKLGR